MDKIFSPIKGRIIEFIKSQGIKKTEFFDNTGISPSNFKGEGAKSEIGGDKIAKILTEYPMISSTWLLLGDGYMLQEDNHSSNYHTINSSISDDSMKKFALNRIPVVDISVAAGTGSYNPEYIKEVECISFPQSMLKARRTYLCVRIKGHSMTPSMLDGGYLIIYNVERQEWADIRDNYVYVVCDTEGRSFVKRIKNRLKQHGFLVLQSDNPDKQNYPNFNLQEDEINTVWYAEWYFTAKIPNIQETFGSKLSELEDKMDGVIMQVDQLTKAININNNQ